MKPPKALAGLRSFLFVGLAALTLLSLMDNDAMAKSRRHRHHRRSASKAFCGGGDKVSGTVYNTPHLDDPRSFSSYISKRRTTYQNFKRAVHTEGSGILPNGDILQYTGKVEKQTCPRYFGDATVRGAAGTCLVPFESIACDRRYYPMGTIIKVDALADQWVRTPPSDVKTQMTGLYKCADVGGAIKGPGRFDFYTGSYGDHDSRNDLVNGDLALGRNRCNKTFTVIMEGAKDYAAANDRLKDFEDASLGTANAQPGLMSIPQRTQVSN